MKIKYLLTPLALALATTLSAAAFAEGRNDGHGGNNNSHDSSFAGAELTDSQENYSNYVNNEGTNNNASVDGSLGGANGNVGVNVAAGDNNQQANAAAIAAADSAFIFASTDINQSAYGNLLENVSVPNNASLKNSANGVSGNLGVNIAAGNYNQQKNDMAIASSGDATSALASANTSQQSYGNATLNSAVKDYGNAQVSLSLNANGSYNGGGKGSYKGSESGTTKGTADQIGNVYLDSWTGVAGGNHGVHPGGNATGHIDLDNQAQGAKDLNKDGGALAFNEDGTYKGRESGDLSFREQGSTSLAGSVSGYIPVVSGFKAAVVNNANVTGSLNGVNGNIGVNVAAGGGNQQSNSLTMASGCNVCQGL